MVNIDFFKGENLGHIQILNLKSTTKYMTFRIKDITSKKKKYTSFTVYYCPQPVVRNTLKLT